MIQETQNDALALKANAAFAEMAQDVIARARSANTEVLIWRNGEVTRLSPDQATREVAEKMPASKTQPTE